jgi:hypothetical protein
MVDYNSGTHAAPTWLPVCGIGNFKPSGFVPKLQNDSDFDIPSGAGSQLSTGYDWSLSMTLQRKRKATDASVYDPGQEALRTAAQGILATNIVEVRYYEVNEQTGPIVEAFQGYASAAWAPAGGTLEVLDAVELTLNGRGLLNVITHPDYAHIAPVLYALYPSTGPAAGGTLVHVVGKGFFYLGVSNVVATGVKLAAHNFAPYTVESDQSIWAISPAEDAGTTNVTVTNAIGASNGLPYITTV